MTIGSTPLGNMAIEVNLDDTKLRQSTSNMKALMKSVNAEFQANMSAVKRTGSEYDVLATRTEGLGKKFQTQEKIVKSLEEAYEKARIEAEKQGASQQQIRAMESKRAQLNKEKASLNDLASAYEKAQDEQNEMRANNQKLESSFSKLDNKIKESADKLKGFGSKMTDLGKNLSMSITAPMVGLGAVALSTAGEAEARASQFKQVFGKLEDDATQSLNNISKTTGLLPNALKDSYIQMAAFAKTSGVDTKGALDLTSRATLAAADAAAFYDRSIDEVTENLQSYLKGNYENDAALGISSTETTRNAKANELYAKSFNELSEEQKQLTLLKMVEDGNKLSGALGQASRESDTLATQTANVRVAFQDFLGELGRPILPMAVQGLKKLSNVGKDLSNQFLGMSDFGKKLTLGFIGFVGIAPIILMAVGGIASGLGALATLGAPILIAVGALTALGVGFTLAYKKSETFRNIVNGALDGVGKAFETIKGTIKGVFELFKGDGSQGVITLSKFLPPSLVQGITLTVDKIRSTFKSMADAVGKVFKGIGKELSTFWNENGKMITQALKNMMAVVKPIISVLGKLFSVTLKVAFVILKEIVVGTFKAIVGVIKGAIKIITGIIQVFSALFTGNWKKLFQGLWKITKGLVQVIWNGINLLFFARILKGGLAFAKGFGKIFPKLWTGIKEIFTKSLNSIFKFVSGIWTKLHKNATSTLTNMYKAIGRILSNLLKNFKTIFDNIWSKTKSIFKSIFEYVPRMIGKMKDGALKGLRAMKNGLDSLMDKMKKKVTDTFGNMVKGAKELPKKLGDGIRNGAGKAVDGVKHLGNKMVGKLGGVVNGTIGGINTVTDKLGIGKKIKEWNVPKFSTGTKNGALASDSLITVGDFGVGNGIGRRELVQFPNGQMQLFEKETTIPAPAGTKVYSNKETEPMLKAMRFSTGTGGSIGSMFANFGKSVIKGFGDLMDYIDNPAKLVEKLIGSVTKKFGFDGLNNFALDFAKGGFNQIKTGVKSFIDKIFNEYASSNADGGEILGFPLTTPYSPHRRPAGYPFNAHHYGIDLATPYGTLLHAPTSGTLTQTSDYNGGLTAILKDKMYTQFFMHLSKVLKTGVVKQGQAIVKTGNSGHMTTGAHLHYQVRKNDGTGAWNTNTIDPIAFLRNKAGGSIKGGVKGKGSWANKIRQAAKQMHTSVSESQVQGILAQIQRESNFNESIVQGNIGDINNLRGTPARGLLQYVPSTFANYKVRGYENINNGYHQLLAFFNNSNWARNLPYGRSGWTPNGHRRYATGGIINFHQFAELGEEGEEVVIPMHPKRRNNAMALLAYTAMKLMPKERGGSGLANRIPNIPKGSTSNNDSEMMKLLMTMISKQDEQIKELKEQTKAIQQDRYTTVEANGREIAKVTHEYHDDFNARKKTFQPRTVM
ncbi:peptidoglycan DD-metalloendopeptidase family protein [Macrococcoides goetzii]|uniref:peptidoglycan DD-metalloendopeptidase family protein n=1 Tax=Macrococcus sp. PK TaxID=2801919 RepID=UPI001F0DC3A6|nr:peptidoglycan DD-metalloendopeptidase family protein [Macrococcus sp. PK]MCH4984224.1 peptidoglycan DD-metalloendopeptidase family protein [Macrococcus sp. PK]